MPLGRQFRNTYWHDDAGNTQASEVNSMTGTSKPEIGALPDHARTENNLQGMLFSPYEATGLKGDTLAGDRHVAIKAALDLNDIDKYRSRLGSMVPGQRVRDYQRGDDGKILTNPRTGNPLTTTTSKRGEKGVSEDIGRIVTALDNTDMPTHLINKVKAPTVLDPSEGRAFAEDHSGRIRLTTKVSKQFDWTGGETVTRPKFERGEPIRNTKFSEQVRKIDWDSDEGAHSDLVGGGKGNWVDSRSPRHPGADVHFWDPSSGEEAHPKPEAYVDNQEHIIHAGLHANIWPGKGKTTDKVIATPFTVYNGMNEHGNEKFRSFHTRHQAVPTGEVEEITTPRKMVTTTERSTSPATIVHEIGHTLDQTGDPFSHRKSLGHKADPIEEGIADGTADRFVRHAGQFEETLHPSYPDRATEIAGKPTSARNGTGYGIDYHHWKGDKIGKALYVAGRAHAAMADGNSANVPTRRSISRQFGIEEPSWVGTNSENQRAVTTSADTMLLGHMYHEHEHVRTALDQLGMKEIGEKAHDTYQRALAKQKPEPEEQWHQMNLIQPTKAGGWVRQDGNG